MGQIIDGAFISDYDSQDIDRRLAIAGGVSNPNLLDNPWFTVNQRGVVTTSTNEAFISDRWHIYRGTGVVNADKTITFTATQSGAVIYQISPYRSDIVGKTVTLSLLKTNGDIQSGQVVIPASGYAGVVFDDGSLSIDTRNNKLQFTKNVVNGQTVNIKAFKLEPGSVSTLGNDVAPDYDLELYKCKAYFRRLRGNNFYVLNGFASSATQADFLNPFGTQPFAKTPVITITGTHTVRNANANYTVSSMIVQENAEHVVTGIRMTTNATNMTGYTMTLYTSDANSYIDISAEL